MTHTDTLYEAVIGLEVHVQLNTSTKIFASDTHAFGQEANAQVSPITLGLPGVLPKLNKEVIGKAIRLGLAMNSEISNYSTFDRKNYFYPDLPKGYQLTQDQHPICIGGHLTFQTDGEEHKVDIHHIHMEEDAGKSIHDMSDHFSMVDLNRAGTPLLEIVTEPCIKSGKAAAAYVGELRKLVRFLDVGDGNMEQGSLRCDVNISVRPKGSDVLGTKVEIKNMNSMRFIRQAVEYEVERQINCLNTGETIVQQTRTYDVSSGKTLGMREKEDAHDYRYFPEPDLPPMMISDEWIQLIKAAMPETPAEMANRLTTEYALDSSTIEFLTGASDVAGYFNQGVDNGADPKQFSSWMMGEVQAYLKGEQKSFKGLSVSPERLARLTMLIGDSKINKAGGKRLFEALLKDAESSVEAMAEELNLIQSDNDDFLIELVDRALEKHPDKVELYRGGKKGLFGVFMSEIVKGSNGQANPKAASALLRKKLENS